MCGKYIIEWNYVICFDDLFIDIDENFFVVELGEIVGWDFSMEVLFYVFYVSVCVLSLEGKLIIWFGGKDFVVVGNFFVFYGIWVDFKGDLYVSEVIVSAGGNCGLVLFDCYLL